MAQAPEAGFGSRTVDDSAYLRGLIETLMRQFAVDRKRIHLTGQSNGGGMSHHMAREHADLIAGIACYDGAMALDLERWQPSEPVNVLLIHGTADDSGAYCGEIWQAGALSHARNWARYNGCEGPVWDPQPVWDLDLTLPGLDTTVLRYTHCPPGGAVELWTINGGTHWVIQDYAPNRSNFSTELIDWLLAHPKP
jgi:polyhydroxybutyrate depolymerase